MAQAMRDPSVVIIGAGMTGILMTIKLREAGITNVTILEKTDKLGGTWRENTYPGVACDVFSYMYTYSFEPNPEWSNRFPQGPEIQEYFERVGRKYGVTDLIRFNEAVTEAQYKDARWTVKTSKGDTIVADFLIGATGILHHPAKPDIEGLDTFNGAMFHTAEWDHSVELKGKRIGVIGTGSTAAQVIPELVNMGADVHVFQRTPQWIWGVADKQYSEEHKDRMRRSPTRMLLHKNGALALFSNVFANAVTGESKLSRVFLEYSVKRNLKRSVKDPELRRKLTPNYRIGCKRLIVNNTFYNAIQKPNAHLITEGIECITGTGIKTVDGEQHDLDVIVLSTGFNPTAYMRPMNMLGKDGLHIDKAWEQKIKAYRSVTMENYPNFFLMLGPNTPIGNYSVIALSEVQTDYVIKLINRWRNDEFDELEAKPEAIENFMADIKEGMKKTAWVGGCQSWYLDSDGDPILWPYSMKQWVEEMKEPDMAAYNTRKVEAPTPRAVVNKPEEVAA